MDVSLKIVATLVTVFLMLCCVNGAFLFESYRVTNRHLYWHLPRWRANLFFGLAFTGHVFSSSIALVRYGLNHLLSRWL